MTIFLVILAWLLIGALSVSVSIVYDEREIKVQDLDEIFLFYTILGPLTFIIMIWYFIVKLLKHIHKNHGKKVLFKLAPKK